MALSFGTRLGPYEVISLLGAGGMGEVYRARDPRLAREVAIKVLPSTTSASVDRRRRFEQEAKVVGALSHPNLLSVFDIGQHEGETYVVFELLEGATLRERLRSGALSVKKAVDYASQIARGLSATHEKGIIHRDLKPENLFVTKDGRVKILDFGLAKLRPELDQEGGTDAATSSAITDAGTVLGTVGYMSPEQVKACPVDHRSDIFSFGSVLYEMLSGKQAFRRGSAAETMNAILKEEPLELARTSGVSPTLERILARCLEKNPDDRFRSAHDLAFALDSASGPSGPAPGPTAATTTETRPATGEGARRHWLIAAAALAVATSGVLLGLRLWPQHDAESSRPGAATAIRVEKLTNRGNAGYAAISPDGRYLAYRAQEEDQSNIWLRDITGKIETRLVGPFPCWIFEDLRFAKDGQSIYYSCQVKEGENPALYRVPLIGGDPRLVHADVWRVDQVSPDGKHLAVTSDAEVLLVADTDGGQERKIGPTSEHGSWSPDSSQLLFFRENAGKFALFAVKADGTGERRLGEFPQRPAGSLWTPGGDGVVLALYKDDHESARLYDLDPATGVTKAIGDSLFRNGEFAWLPGRSALVLSGRVGDGRNALHVVSYPDGKFERIPADTHEYSGISLSADGSKLVSSQGMGRSDIVVSSDPEKGTFKKIVSGTDVVYTPCWTADGKLVYSSNDGGSYDLYVSDADGSNRKQLTFDQASHETQPAASPNGRYLVFVSDRTGERGLYRINRDGTGLMSLTPKPTPHYRDYRPSITPDSRWVLYNHWWGGPSVWKVPIDGGTPVLVKGAVMRGNGVGGEWAWGASVSPDGKSLAFFHCTQDGKTLKFSGVHVAVASADGRITQKFAALYPGIDSGDDSQVQWSHDGSALYYDNIHEPNVWKQPLSGGPPVRVTHFEEPLRFFNWSFDGKTLAASRWSTQWDVVMITNFH